MKKTFLTIALLPILLLTLSGYNDHQLGVMPGNKAPMIELQNDTKTVSLSDFKGKYVLLSFWSSSNANSRMLCNRYDAWTKKNDPNNKKVSFIGVNLDENNMLFSQIVKADNLLADAQFNAKGNNAEKIYSDYHLTQGLGTLLLDQSARVIAANPDQSLLAATIAD
jgi:thiol-disulfide isomerase/thioredoxin